MKHQSRREKMTKRRMWISKKKRIEKLENDLQCVEEKIDQIMGLVDGGFDVNYHERSWAILCLAGKPEYVRMVSMGDRDISYLRDLLRKWDRSNIIKDVPIGMML